MRAAETVNKEGHPVISHGAQYRPRQRTNKTMKAILDMLTPPRLDLDHVPAPRATGSMGA